MAKKSAFQVMTARGHDCGIYYGTSAHDALVAWALDTGYCSLAAALETNPGMWVR